MRVAVNGPGKLIGSQLIAAVLDQLLLSAFGLCLSLVLIRVWTPYLFGIFWMAMALSIVALSVQNALIGSQLNVLRAQSASNSEETLLLASFWTANTCLVLVAVPVSLAIMALATPHDHPLTSWAAAGFVGCILFREYLRAYLFSESRATTVLIADTVYVLAAIGGLLGCWYSTGTLDMASAFFWLGAANVIAAVPIRWFHRRAFSLDFKDLTLTRIRGIWRTQSRWALLGVVSYEITTRAHVFIVSAFFGPAALGVIQAGAAIFRPLGVMIQAWKLISLPVLSRLEAERKREQARAMVWCSAGGAVAGSAVFALVVWLSWPLLELKLFRNYYGIGLVACLWGVVMTIRLLGDVGSTQLQSLGRFRELSFASLSGSVAAMATLLAVVNWGHFEWAVSALAVGYLMEFTLIIHLLFRLAGRSARTKGFGLPQQRHFS
jgi:O-antigen/teichoic acid export membrane protein